MLKKIITVLIALTLAIGLSAQTQVFKTSKLCQGYRNQYGAIQWGPWERCVLNIRVSEYYINVGSERVQYYHIKTVGNTYRTQIGDLRVDITAIDEEDIPVDISLIEDDYGLGVYFFYNDVAWAYYIPDETIW